MIHPAFCVRWLRRSIIGLLAVPVTAMAQAPTDLPPLPEDLLPVLRPYLVSALGQAPQMILSNINIATAEATRTQDFAGLMPNLSGSASYSASKVNVVGAANASSTASGVYYSLGVSQPIFQWGAVKNRALSGTVGVQLAQHLYSDAYRTLVVSLRVQFLLLVQKKIALRNAEFALKQADEGLTLAETQLKSGVISPEAMLEPRLATDEARLGRDRALEDLEHARRVFLLTVGRDDLGVETIPGEIPRPTYDPQMVGQLLAAFDHSGAKDALSAPSYRDYIKMADIDYRIARVNLLPKLSINAGISQANTVSASANFVSQVGVLSNYWNLVASWSIFDGFATRGAKLSALSRKRSYQRSLQNITAQALTEAHDLERQLDFAWRDTVISETRRDVSVTAVQRLQDQLKIGKASQSAVSAAQLSAYSLEFTLAGTRAAYLNDWSQFVSTLCVDPIISMVPASYLKDGK